MARGSSACTRSARIPPAIMQGSAWSRHTTLSGPNHPGSGISGIGPVIAALTATPCSSARALFDGDRLHHVADFGVLRDVHAVDHVPEEVVVLRELARAVVDGDEELRPVRVGTGVRHGHRAERVLALHRLVAELVARATGSGAVRAATLDHEVGNLPV